MGERLNEFRKDAFELQKKVSEYQNTLETFYGAFPEDLEIPDGQSRAVSGKITISGSPPQFRRIEVAVIIRKFASADLKVSLGVEIGPSNIAVLEEIDLPVPNKVLESDLDKINNDDLLGEIAGKIGMLPDAKQIFTPVN